MAAREIGQRGWIRAKPPEDGQGPVGVGGWLLLLCALLLVYRPLSLAYAAPRVLESLPIRGTPTALLLTARILCVAIGISAGIALVREQRIGVRLAQISLVATTATDLFIYATSYYPNSRFPGDTPLYVAATLMYSTVWLAYLWRSKRVANTFD